MGKAAYTLPLKKDRFRKIAFLLGKSVHVGPHLRQKLKVLNQSQFWESVVDDYETDN